MPQKAPAGGVAQAWPTRVGLQSVTWSCVVCGNGDARTQQSFTPSVLTHLVFFNIRTTPLGIAIWPFQRAPENAGPSSALALAGGPELSSRRRNHALALLGQVHLTVSVLLYPTVGIWCFSGPPQVSVPAPPCV